MFPALSLSATTKPAASPGAVAARHMYQVAPPSLESDRLIASPPFGAPPRLSQPKKAVCRGASYRIGPGKVGFGAAILVRGLYVSPPSVDVCTTVFRGSCWVEERRAV